MATMDEWASFFSGNYQGWIRVPAGEWEDLVGSVKLDCAVDKKGSLKVTITILEYGTWSGSLKLENRVMEGSTGQKGTSFRLAFRQRGAARQIQGCFDGGLYGPRGEQLFEVHFTSDWRRRPPRRR